MTEVGRDAPWNPQNADADCSANADRHAKGDSEDAKQPFFAGRRRINKGWLPLHAFGLSDSALRGKSTGPRHVDLDFALPSVQLAGRLLAERESKQFPSRNEAAQRLQGAVAYAVVSWPLIQIATRVFPFFEIPN